MFCQNGIAGVEHIEQGLRRRALPPSPLSLHGSRAETSTAPSEQSGRPWDPLMPLCAMWLCQQEIRRMFAKIRAPLSPRIYSVVELFVQMRWDVQTWPMHCIHTLHLSTWQHAHMHILMHAHKCTGLKSNFGHLKGDEALQRWHECCSRNMVCSCECPWNFWANSGWGNIMGHIVA